MTVQPPAANTTRARLLEAARYLFWEKGYTATGMAEILERADNQRDPIPVAGPVG